MLETLKVTLVGTAPLIMHNGQGANPDNKLTRALADLTAGGSKKTPEQREEIRKIEWLRSIYQDESGLIALPADNVLAMILDGAKKSRNGPKIKAGVFETQPYYPLDYEGSKDPVALYDAGSHIDCRPMVVQRSRIMRVRARFDSWSLTIEINVNSSVVDPKTVLRSIEAAGELCGLCDSRPRFGRFVVQS